MKKIKVILFFLVVIIASTAWPVQADISPPRPPRGTNIEPGVTTTQVRMVSERVVIDIQPSNKAIVRAWFLMNNQSDIAEEMMVRFPNGLTNYGDLCEMFQSGYTPISDFQVWVDGNQVKSERIPQFFDRPKEYPPGYYPADYCWESFFARFSPHQDVKIEVAYTQESSQVMYSSLYDHSYILETGAGWFGTIGEGEVIIRLPYEINSINVPYYNGEIRGQEVYWHFTDLEPTYKENIWIGFLPFEVWSQIQQTENAVKFDSMNGEQWGILGKLYKQVLLGDFYPKGLMSSEAAIIPYQKSKEAYQKAIEILPEDADWRYGYAELLCVNAEFLNFDQQTEYDRWLVCGQQLKKVLDLDPGHNKTIEFLTYYYSEGSNPAFHYDDLKIEFLPVPTFTQIPMMHPTDIILTATPKSSQTMIAIVPSIIVAIPVENQQIEEVMTTDEITANVQKPVNYLLIGGVGITAVLIALVFFIRKIRN